MLVKHVIKAIFFTLLSLFLLTAAIFSSYYSLSKLEIARVLFQQGQTVQGVVTARSEHNHRQSGRLVYEYRVSYEYEVTDPTTKQLKRYDRQVLVSYNAFSRLAIGSPVEVTYMASDPRVAEIKGELDDSAKTGYYTVGLLAILLVILLPFVIYRTARTLTPTARRKPENDRTHNTIGGIVRFFSS
jgi:hypothetical protein